VESFGTLKLIYFAHVQSIMNYGIIFWAGSSYANKVFILQKKIIRIIANAKTRETCREIFKKLEILPFYSQYIVTYYLLTRRIIYVGCGFCISIY
jgi:hypothetical protein